MVVNGNLGIYVYFAFLCQLLFVSLFQSFKETTNQIARPLVLLRKLLEKLFSGSIAFTRGSALVG